MLTSSKAAEVLKSLSDETLMTMVAVKDDQRAFAELYRRWRPSLCGYFMRRLGRWHTADDLSSKTLVELYRKRSAYESGLAVKQWFFGYARNVLRNYRRLAGVRREHVGIALDVRDKRPSVVESLESNERRRMLRGRLYDLTEPQAAAVVAALDGSDAHFWQIRTLAVACERLRSDPVLAALI